MQITSVGLDLAKNVIQLHAVNQHGKAVLKKSLRRNQVFAVLRQFNAVPDRHGGVQQRSLLGEEIADNGPYGPIDGAPVCEALRQD